ncbi:unnamed protein product, partial [Coregonus sp. 'balchen']
MCSNGEATTSEPCTPRHPGSIDTINAPATPEPCTPRRQGSILGWEEKTHCQHNQRIPEPHTWRHLRPSVSSRIRTSISSVKMRQQPVQQTG